MADRPIVTDENQSGGTIVYVTRRELPQTIAGLAAGIWTALNTGPRDPVMVSAAGEVVDPPSDAIHIPDLIRLVHRSATGAAPEAVTMEPDFALVGAAFGIEGPAEGAVFDPRMHDVAYVWWWDDDYQFSAPQNIRAGNRSSGTSVGPWATHVYRQPGTYAARLDVYGYVDGSLVHAYDAYSVEVQSRDSVFSQPSAHVFYVSSSGNFANAPAGAEQVTDIQVALNNDNGLDRGGYKLILVRGDGDTYTSNGREFGFNRPEGSSYTAWIMKDPASTTRPVITMTGNPFMTLANGDPDMGNCDLVISGLDLDTGYRSADVANSAHSRDIFGMADDLPNMLLVDDCIARGAYQGLFIRAARGLGKMIVNDTAIEDYSLCGALLENMEVIALVGCRIISAVDAVVDDGEGGGWGVRLANNISRAIIQNCDFFSRQGWSPATENIAYQPCLRLSFGTAGTRAIVSRSSFEGGMTAIATGVGYDTSRASNIIFDGNDVLGCHQTTECFGISGFGVTIRNNTMVFPTSGRMENMGDPIAFVAVKPDANPADPVNQASPVRVYNNTMVNMFGGAGAAIVTNEIGAPLINENNLVYQPASTPPQTDDAPLVTAPPIWTPREIGYLSTTVALQPQTATPADAMASFAPAPGSAAIGSAEGRIAVLNNAGDVRELPASRGAA